MVNETTQHTHGLHYEIVQDGISSLANVKDEMIICEWVSFSDKNLSEIRNAMSSVKTFQIAKLNADKTFMTRVMPKKINCLIFAFRATNAVLYPDRAQPS